MIELKNEAGEKCVVAKCKGLSLNARQSLNLLLYEDFLNGIIRQEKKLIRITVRRKIPKKDLLSSHQTKLAHFSFTNFTQNIKRYIDVKAQSYPSFPYGYLPHN